MTSLRIELKTAGSKPTGFPLHHKAQTDDGGLEPLAFYGPNRLATDSIALILHHPNGKRRNRTPNVHHVTLGFKPSYRPFRGAFQIKNRTALLDHPVLCSHVHESTQQPPDGPKTVDYSTGMIAVVCSFIPLCTYTHLTVFLSINGGNRMG